MQKSMLASEAIQNRQLNATVEALAAEKAQLVRAVAEQRAKIERLEALLGEEKRSSRRQAEAATAATTTSAAEQKKLRELHDEKRRLIERLETSVVEQRNTIERLEAAVGEQRSHIDQLETLNLEQQRTLVEAENQMKESQLEKAQLEHKLRAQNDELVAAQEHVQEADQLVQNAKARIATLEVIRAF